MKRLLLAVWDFVHTLIYHRQIIAFWKEEAEKDFDIKMVELKANYESMQATFEHPGIQVMVGTMVRMMEHYEAANYLAITVSAPDDVYEFIIQKKHGETPSEQNQRLKQEIAELRAQLTELQQ